MNERIKQTKEDDTMSREEDARSIENNKSYSTQLSANSKVSVSQRLQELMDELGIRQVDLAKKTGIDKAVISQYLSGKRTPAKNKLEIIANVFSVSEAWLLGYNVSMKAEEQYVKYNETAKRIKTAMEKIGIYARELSNLSGISESSISQYVNGMHKPSEIASLKLSKVLRVDHLWLMGFDTESDFCDKNEFDYYTLQKIEKLKSKSVEDKLLILQILSRLPDESK